MPGAVLDALLQAIQQQAAIGQAGQGIVQGLVFKGILAEMDLFAHFRKGIHQVLSLEGLDVWQGIGVMTVCLGLEGAGQD